MQRLISLYATSAFMESKISALSPSSNQYAWIPPNQFSVPKSFTGVGAMCCCVVQLCSHYMQHHVCYNTITCY